MKIKVPEQTSYVMLRFDDEATAYVQTMKDRLSKLYNTRPIGSTPHFTFTDYVGNRNKLFNELSFFCEDYKEFPFTFWNVGNFFGSGTLFLEPKLPHVFRRMQHHLVDVLGKPKSKYLEPGLWDPHCTVVKGVKSGLVNDARLQLLADFDVRDATAVGFEISTKGQEPLFVELTK